MTTVEMKQCTKCQEVKPLTEFSSNGRSKNGKKRAACKACESARQRATYGTFDFKCWHARSSADKKARKVGVKNTLTLAEVREVLGADNCDYCDKHLEQSEKTLEHVLPFEYGGENTFGNVTLACASCNSKKRNSPAFEFMLLHGDAGAARRLLYVLADRNGIEPQEYLYTLAQAGIRYRALRFRAKHYGESAQ